MSNMFFVGYIKSCEKNILGINFESILYLFDSNENEKRLK